jgi:hypothetical protein
MESGGALTWPMHFILRCDMKLSTYHGVHGGKPEASHQLVEAIDEATVGIRNKKAIATLTGTMIRRIPAV